MMLLTAIGADVFGHRLMQQPGPLCYALVGAIVGACYAASYALVRCIGVRTAGLRPLV
jgi:hypothetical protein